VPKWRWRSEQKDIIIQTTMRVPIQRRRRSRHVVLEISSDRISGGIERVRVQPA
jgi:hypothetical protein